MTMEMPKGNVYSQDDFNESPLFPSYMEACHKRWLGFIPPEKGCLQPQPAWEIENTDTLPAPGVEYILLPYKDASYTERITYSEAKTKLGSWRLKADGCQYEIITDKASGLQKGIKIVSIDDCTYVRTLSFMSECIKFIKYFEMRSVTETMNNAFYRFIEEIDRVEAVRKTFTSLLDIRKLENLYVRKS